MGVATTATFFTTATSGQSREQQHGHHDVMGPAAPTASAIFVMFIHMLITKAAIALEPSHICVLSV